MQPLQPPPLADGNYRPSKRAFTAATVGVVITLGAAVVLVLALREDLSRPTQLVGVIILGIMLLFFAAITLALLRGISRARLRVDAAGVSFPQDARPGPGRSARTPWAELGTLYVLYAENQQPAALRASAVGLVVPGTTRYGLVATDPGGNVLATLIGPAWAPEVVLGLASRANAETGSPVTLAEVGRLPFPGEFRDTFTAEDVRGLALP